METLVAIDQHRNQYCGRSKPRVSNRFSSSPSRGFMGFNCRTYEPTVGILPSPSPVFSLCNNYHEPKSPQVHSEPPKQQKRSSPIAIIPKTGTRRSTFSEDIEDFSCSELWAGPAYSNSPPPSSLPIPKFSLRQKRSVSLELPLPSPDFELTPTAKSAPSSPTRDSFISATADLRRILHLDIADD